MASQESTASTISVPPEIIENQDTDFVSEINTVDSLYFSNAEVIEGPSVSDEGGESDTEENSEYQDPGVIQEAPPLTGRREDDEEITSQYEFRLSGCGCSKIYGHPCSEELVWDRLSDYRQSCLEYTREELDLVLKVQMLGHRKNGDTTESMKHKTKDRERSFQEYFLFGKQVCQKTFSFAHAVGYNKLRRVGSHLDTYGMAVRLHGNKGKSPKNALTVSNINNVIMFLQSYANKNGLPLPGRLPNYRDSKVMLLPSDKTKADIYQMYLSATSKTGVRQVGQSTFYKLWSEHCPTLVIIKPATDLCAKCQNYSMKLSNGGNLTEEEKMEDLRQYNDHIQKAKVQRDHYRAQVEESKMQYTALPEDKKQRGHESCSLAATQHYSFDYAQQVHYPHYAQQVGPLFFKTPRKCQCFGVCAEGSGSQIFYLVDEAEHKGKGANTVTSLLHHQFLYHGYGEEHVQLHMDNCSGQNKNNTVIWYGMWRVLTGKHKSVEYSMMEAGHTKFHPDWHFGLWKVRWRHSSVVNMDQMADSVKMSSRNGHNIPQSNPRLREVNLAMNGLGNEGAFGVAEIIKQSGTISFLDVTYNRIGLPGAQIIGKALEGNEVLKVFRIGHNPIGLEGMKLVFQGICSDRSSVSDLDLSGIEIDKDFKAKKEELLEKRKVNIKHGKLLGDYVIVGPTKKKMKLFDTPLEEITTGNIMVVIRTYCDVNGINLIDSLTSFDKKKEKKVMWVEFLTAFLENGIELTSQQTETLEDLIKDYRTDDDRVDFSAILYRDTGT